VKGNETQNVTGPKPGLVESLAAEAARLAGGGLRLFSTGIRSKLGILVVAMIVSVSAVSIAARSSWVRVGRGRRRQKPAQDVWQDIEGKAMSATRSTGQEPSIDTAGPAPQVILLRRKPSRVVAARKVVVSRRAVSAGIVRKPPVPEEAIPTGGERRVSTGQFLGIHRVGPVGRIGSQQPAPVGRPVGKPAAAIAQRPVHAQPAPARVPAGLGTARAAQQTQGRQYLAQTHQDIQREAEGKRADSGAVSQVDMEYIENLIRLGFTKEAEEELRKLHKAR